MAPRAKVDFPPEKPLIIFDGNCNFCSAWIARWQQATGPNVDYVAAQEPSVAARFPELSREWLTRAVQLIATDGNVYSGAEAVFRLLAIGAELSWPLWLYEIVPGVAELAEACYRFVANHRQGFGTLTKLFWGQVLTSPSYQLVQSLFLRSIALIYLFAFVSLGMQVLGLVGCRGILPVDQMMTSVREQVSQRDIGIARYRLVPTLCWLNTSDGFLRFQCAAGIAGSILLLFGLIPAPSLFILWLLYLSLVTVGQDFLSFQWDNLLLEVGWLAIFLAPLERSLKWRGARPPSRTVVRLLRWLLFRLMFESGCVKLLSGDPSWHNLTALEFHYETQPLPTWIGWYMHQLPASVQKASTAIVLIIELGVPFLIFAPRRLRFFGCAVLVAFQLLIMITGNYCFFNLLTMALCLLLLDDEAVRQVFPPRWRKHLLPGEKQDDWAAVGAVSPAGPPKGAINIRTPSQRATGWLLGAMAAVVLLVSLMQFAGMFKLRVRWPASIEFVYNWIAPLRSVNSYGLFAVMTKVRREIVVEGSNDGQDWLAYRFKHKPGDSQRRPRFIEPFQPRLDWQMWFAALGSYRDNPWFISFCSRLLEGSPEVLDLLERNPFPKSPPRYVRAQIYNYRFSDWKTRHESGVWWIRTSQGEYCPVLSLREREGRTGIP